MSSRDKGSKVFLRGYISPFAKEWQEVLLGKYFDDPSYDAAFERCINLMTDMMVKYGPKVLQTHRQMLMDAVRYPDWSPVQDQELRLRRMENYQTRFKHSKIAVQMYRDTLCFQQPRDIMTQSVLIHGGQYGKGR